MPAVNEEYDDRLNLKKIQCDKNPVLQWDPFSSCYIIKVDIQRLPEDQLMALLSQQNDYGYNALMLAVKYQPDVLAMLINAMQKLPKNEQMAILSQQNQYRDNALRLAAEYQPDALATLLNAIEILSVEDQITILSQRNLENKSILLSAVLRPSNTLPLVTLLNKIQALSQDKQIALLSEKDQSGFNIIMHAATSEANSLAELLRLIEALPVDKQLILLSQNDDFYCHNILTFNAHQKPDAQPIILNAIHQLSLNIQAKLLPQKDMNASLKHNIASLKDTGLEGAIKQCLQAMHYNKTDKQIAILDALRELKKTHPDNTDTAIKKAVNNSGNPLYHALNIKRYPFSFFRPANSETGSLQTIRQLSTNMTL